jgi:hypothetical protein
MFLFSLLVLHPEEDRSGPPSSCDQPCNLRKALVSGPGVFVTGTFDIYDVDSSIPLPHEPSSGTKAWWEANLSGAT